MPGFKDRIGDQYGRLVVIGYAGKNREGLTKKATFRGSFSFVYYTYTVIDLVQNT